VGNERGVDDVCYLSVTPGLYSYNGSEVDCETGTSGQRQSHGGIELVRFLDSYEGGGARAVFAGVLLLYRNNTPHDHPSKFAHR